MAIGGSGLIRGITFGGSGLIRGMTFGGSGLIKRDDLWWEWPDKTTVSNFK